MDTVIEALAALLRAILNGGKAAQPVPVPIPVPVTIPQRRPRR